MTPTGPMLGTPSHPWMKFTLPIALLGSGAIAAVATTRAMDSDRSRTDRIVSGVVGGAAVIGVAALGNALGIRGARFGDEAMEAVRKGTATYDDFAWPRGTHKITSGGASWWVTPHEGLGNGLFGGAVIGGLFGGAGAAFAWDGPKA